MFNNWFKKEKPIFTGYRFGFGSGGGGGETAVTSGGTIVEDGSTKYHIFLSDDVFTCADGPHSCTVLAIGGGGGSGDTRDGAGCGGGGGAGGYVNAPFTITNGTYPVHQLMLLLIQTVNMQELHQLLILLSPHMVVDKVVDMEAKQDNLVHLLVADKMDKDQEQQIGSRELPIPSHQLLKEMQVV